MIKTIIILFYFSCVSGTVFSLFAQTNPWKKLHSPVNSTLRRLVFVDSLTGWAAGSDGVIIHTTNGGTSWVMQNSNVHTFITDIFFANNNNGWALTLKDTFPFNTVILKTNNGGDTWVSENFQDASALMRTVFFFDSLKGFIGGSYIARTSDGGTTWTRADIDSNMVSGFPIYKFNFYSQKFGYACGGRIDIAGVVWRTNNYGLNWTAQGISADEIFDIFILDSLHAISLSGDPEGLYAMAKIRTTDGGLNWINEYLDLFGLSFAIDFRTYKEGWSASGYKFLFTSDRGNIWSEVETPDRSVIFDLQFTDARTGYAVGQDGVILKLKAPFEPSNVEDKVYPSEDFVLYQNYPNPFNSTTMISYQLVVNSNVTLRVYDLHGNEIATPVDEYVPAGKHKVEFNPESNIKKPASGIYFYQLRIRGSEMNSEQVYTQTKKMIYLK